MIEPRAIDLFRGDAIKAHPATMQGDVALGDATVMEGASATKRNGDFTSQFLAGGELLGQGSHLIDLARWFLGKLTDVRAKLRTFFWSADVEDNRFVRPATSGGAGRVFLHATSTEWKNLFTSEIYGHVGKLAIEGMAILRRREFDLLQDAPADGAAGNGKMGPGCNRRPPRLHNEA